MLYSVCATTVRHVIGYMCEKEYVDRYAVRAAGLQSFGEEHTTKSKNCWQTARAVRWPAPSMLPYAGPYHRPWPVALASGNTACSPWRIVAPAHARLPLCLAASLPLAPVSDAALYCSVPHACPHRLRAPPLAVCGPPVVRCCTVQGMPLAGCGPACGSRAPLLPVPLPLPALPRQCRARRLLPLCCGHALRCLGLCADSGRVLLPLPTRLPIVIQDPA